MWVSDGEIKCFSSHQWFFLIVLVIYILPFFSSLALGLKMMKEKHISTSLFMSACFLPLPTLLYCVFKKILKKFFNKTYLELDNQQRNNIHKLSDTSNVIEEAFVGPYKSNGQAFYCESVLGARRLLLTLTLFVNDSLLKFILLQFLCIIFFCHHILINPFKHRNSNNAETISLFLITVTTFFNAVIACFLYNGIIDAGPLEMLFKFMEITKDMAVYCLLLFIAVLEINVKIKKFKIS